MDKKAQYKELDELQFCWHCLSEDVLYLGTVIWTDEHGNYEGWTKRKYECNNCGARWFDSLDDDVIRE